MKLRMPLVLCAVLSLVGVPAPGTAQLTEGTELAGIIDIHWHLGPPTIQSINRSMDAVEAALVAKRHGMRAIMFKQHYLETASWAYLVHRMVPGVQLFGGMALNRSVGGLNPVAVENVATFPNGVGRIIFFPTFESEHYNPGSPVAVPIRGADGELLPEVYEILDIMARYDMTMSTGHSSPEESLMLIRAAKAAGVDRMFVQHPHLSRVGMSVETMQEAASLGSLLEFVLGEATGPMEEFEHWAEMIREVGPENVVIGSDRGQRANAIPPDAYRVAIPRMREAGFTQAEIDLMTKTNPARVLALEPW